MDIEENLIRKTIDDLRSRGSAYGQLLCMRIDGTRYSASVERALKAVQPGGIIFFTDNISDRKTLHHFLLDIEVLYDAMNIPRPIFMIDQEGGRVDRLSSLFGPMYSATSYVEKGIPASVYAKDIAKRMHSVGLHAPLCPVFDLNPSNAKGAIGDRSFGENPERVSAYLKEILIVLRREKIFSTGKHFPGHGCTQVDTHFQLPSVSLSLHELQLTHLRPYLENIDLLDSIMMGHILVPAVDTVPASLSSKWMRTILRQEYAFDGLILTDDLTMGALRNFGSSEEVAWMALSSGADMAMFCAHQDRIKALFQILKQREVGRQFDEQLMRILKMKKRFGIWRP